MCWVTKSTVLLGFVCGLTCVLSDEPHEGQVTGGSTPKMVPPPPPHETVTSAPESKNNTCENGTCSDQNSAGSITTLLDFGSNKEMLMRTFYVLIGLTAIIVVYFVVRTVRSNRKRNRAKRYGLLATNEDTLEMAPLDVDDDEDDLTVFDINRHGK